MAISHFVQCSATEESWSCRPQQCKFSEVNLTPRSLEPQWRHFTSALVGIQLLCALRYWRCAGSRSLLEQVGVRTLRDWSESPSMPSM